MKVISIFGGSHPRPGQPEYELAYDLGRRLAEAGLTVATGGYIGTMSAVSQGAADCAANSGIIGVTCDEIEGWRPVRPNRWITREIRYHTLVERMAHLVAENDGIIALAGSVGTLAEVALAWNQLLVNVIPPRPFILLGDQWRRILDVFLAHAPLPESGRALVQLADTPEEAVALLT